VGRWHRVFGQSEAEPDRAELVAQLRTPFREDAAVRFRGDDQGWFAAEVLGSNADRPWVLNRFLATEEGVRHELNSWAAWVEADETVPQREALMQRLIGARQLFTFELNDDHLDGFDLAVPLDGWCVELCRFLARSTQGLYQVDGGGLFAMNGVTLVLE
jgi:hypothetical protein